MRVGRVPQTYRNIKRIRQIIGVLVKYGLSDLIDQLKLSNYIEVGRKIISFRLKERKTTKLTRAKRLVLALQELGPTFIKIGQFLSTRPDLISPEFIEELKKLQDEVPPFEFDKVKPRIEAELNAPIKDIFVEFDEKPIAAASIAQVHAGKLRNGDRVVVKLRRPDVEEIINTDIDILSVLAGLAEKHIAESEIYDPVGIVREFTKTLRREMDFTREAHNMERFAINFLGDETFSIAKVYWNFTSKRILTMEHIDGIKITELERLKEAGLDRKIIAERGADVFLKQVLVHGLFHGDPHPGNLFVLKDNTICPLDYGIVGRIDDQTKNQMIRLIVSVIRKDVDSIIKIFLNVGVVDIKIDMRGLRIDLLEFIERYYKIPLKRLDIGTIVNDLFEIIHNHRIRIPADWTLMAKALVLIEGVGRELNPEFDMIEHTKPFLRKLMMQRLAPKHLIKSLLKTLDDYHELLNILPKDTADILGKIKNDQLSISFQHKGLDKFISMLDKSTNRLSFSLIILGLVVGSSLIMQASEGPLVLGFPLLGLFGYSVAAILGLWLAVIILRSRNL